MRSDADAPFMGNFLKNGTGDQAPRAITADGDRLNCGRLADDEWSCKDLRIRVRFGLVGGEVDALLPAARGDNYLHLLLERLRRRLYYRHEHELRCGDVRYWNIGGA